MNYRNLTDEELEARVYLEEPDAIQEAAQRHATQPIEYDDGYEDGYQAGDTFGYDAGYTRAKEDVTAALAEEGN